MITGARFYQWQRRSEESKTFSSLLPAFLPVPAIFPFVLPALAGLLAGTALGAFIAEKTGLIIALATIYFIGVVLYFLRGRESAGAGRSAEESER